jgi:hypothetical protein
MLRNLIAGAVAEKLFDYCVANKCDPGYKPAQGFIDLWCSRTFPGWSVRVNPPVIKLDGEPDFMITTCLYSFE